MTKPLSYKPHGGALPDADFRFSRLAVFPVPDPDGNFLPLFADAGPVLEASWRKRLYLLVHIELYPSGGDAWLELRLAGLTFRIDVPAYKYYTANYVLQYADTPSLLMISGGGTDSGSDYFHRAEFSLEDGSWPESGPLALDAAARWGADLTVNAIRVSGELAG